MDWTVKRKRGGAGDQLIPPAGGLKRFSPKNDQMRMTEKRPQSYQQIGEVLDMLHRVHSEAGRLCREAAAAAGHTRYGMVAQALAERQEATAMLVAESRRKLVDSMRETWVQYVPADGVDRTFESLEASATDPQSLPRMVVEAQNEIAELLQVVRGESPSVELEEFLDAIAANEFAEAKACTRIVQDMDEA